MDNISFNDGYKEYTINNDESKVIRFNPSDMNIVSRVSDAVKAIESITIDMKNQDIALNDNGTIVENSVANLETAGKFVVDTDKKIREQIDYILGNPVCDIAFGGQSCLSMVGGVPLYERFLDVILPVIKKDVETEQKASQKRIEKHTKAVKK